MEIYLDNSATTRPFDAVVDAVCACMRDTFYNASAAYGPAVDAERRMRAVRGQIARALGAREDEVVFVSGGTEADNLAILGTAALQRKPMRFLCSAVEHPAVLEAMARVKEMGHDVRTLSVTSRGVLDLDAAEALLSPDTALVSVMQVNNETGAVQPIAALRALMDRLCPGARLHVDGVQGFLRVPVSLSALRVDLYALSAHKIHGPKGVGALVVRKGTRLAPVLLGGGQEGGLRSGTYNTPGIAGMGAAVEAFSALEDPCGRMARLKDALSRRLLAGVPGARINGPLPGEPDAAPHILNVSFPNVRGEVLLHALEGQGIYVSTGSACSSHGRKVSQGLRAMGLSPQQAEGAIRFSLSPMNTPQEIERAADAAIAAHAQLSQFRRR